MAVITSGRMILSGPIQHRRGTIKALEDSSYIPVPGEILIAVDTGEMRAGDGIHAWKDLPSYDGTEIADSYEETKPGKALDAVKGKELNDRVEVLEGITCIDCGEITG